MKNLLWIACFLMTLPLAAQQEKGDRQMSLSLSYKSNSGDNVKTTSSFNFQYSVSKFYTRNLEIGISYAGSIATGFSYSGLSPFMSYNFLSKNGRFVFYMGAQYLLNSTTFDSGTSTSTTVSGGVGAKAGIRSYMSDNVFIFIGPNYSGFAHNQNQFDMTAGIGVLFKKTKKTQ